jgi:hypothetical protein
MSKRDTDSNGTLVVTYREDEGEVDKRRLAGILGAATTMMMLLLIVTLSLGMVGAAMGVGMGGFVASFGNVSSPDGGYIYPVIGQQAACSDAPQLEASLSGDTTITDYVEFYKDLPIPRQIRGTLTQQDAVRITILSELTGTNNISASNLELRLTALEAEDVVLGSDTASVKSTIREFGPNQYSYNNTTSNTRADNASYAPTGAGANALNGTTEERAEFAINASGGFSLKNGTAAAHQVAFQRINLPQVDIGVNFLNSSYNGSNSSGVATRVVEPSNRTCKALAEASQPSSFNTPGEAVDAGQDAGNAYGYPSDENT